MNNFTQTTVSYKGEDVIGLTLPYSVQRMSNVQIPENYVPIGKQRFSRGLKLCFIKEDLIKKSSPRLLKKNEQWISGYKTNLDLEADKIRVAEITKECFKKDNSKAHKAWLINCAKNNMGLNSFPNLAVQIVNDNWN